MPVFTLVPISATLNLVSGGYPDGIHIPPCGASPCFYGSSSLLEAVKTRSDSKSCLFSSGGSAGTTRVSIKLSANPQLVVITGSSAEVPFPSGFVVVNGFIQVSAPSFIAPSWNSDLVFFEYYHNGLTLTTTGTTSCGSLCNQSRALPVAGIGVSSLTFGNYGALFGNIPPLPGTTHNGVDCIKYIGTYTLWSTQIALALNNDFTIGTVTDGALQLLEPDQILVNGVATTILTQSAGSLTFTMPTMVGGVDYIIEGYVSGVGYVYFGYVTIPDYSGIYVAGNAFSGPGRDQFYDRSTTPPTTIGVKIPNPTIRTGFISDEDNYE